MGLSVREIDRETRAIEFYDLLSSFGLHGLDAYSDSIRHAAAAALVLLPDHGRRRSQRHLKSVKDNALLAKYSGGLGNDWTRVRGLGAHIKGTNGESQGVVPFLKVANDTAIAVNQGGKRKGAVCAYLETWHIDVRGIPRPAQETPATIAAAHHDMNTANWVPDFVHATCRGRRANGRCSRRTKRPICMTSNGQAFAERYAFYEAKVARGEIRVFKQVRRHRPVAENADHAV